MIGRCAPGPGGDPGRDDGVSLVELLVVMLLTTLLGGMILATFVRGADAVYSADARGSATETTKVVTENLARSLRLAVDPDGTGSLTAFATATPTEATFYAADGTKTTALASPSPAASPTLRADAPPVKVRIWLDASGVVRQTTVPPVTDAAGTTTWTGAGTTRVLARHVVTGGRPLFTYLAAGDTPNTSGVTTTSLPNSAGTVTGATALAAIKSVETWVTIRSTKTKTASTTTAVGRVTLLNA